MQEVFRMNMAGCIAIGRTAQGIGDIGLKTAKESPTLWKHHESKSQPCNETKEQENKCEDQK